MPPPRFRRYNLAPSVSAFGRSSIGTPLPSGRRPEGTFPPLRSACGGTTPAALCLRGGQRRVAPLPGEEILHFVSWGASKKPDPLPPMLASLTRGGELTFDRKRIAECGLRSAGLVGSSGILVWSARRGHSLPLGVVHS